MVTAAVQRNIYIATARPVRFLENTVETSDNSMNLMGKIILGLLSYLYNARYLSVRLMLKRRLSGELLSAGLHD